MTDPAETASTVSTSLTPCLWFDDDLEDAVSFWTSVFPRSSMSLNRGEDGRVFTGDWVLDGLAFRGINGGPMHAGFTETVSLSIACADQAEADYYWHTLVAGGQESQCGWLKDRFGFSWQVVPQRLFELLSDPDPVRAGAAMQSMLGMQRIVVADLEAAADAAAGAAAGS